MQIQFSSAVLHSMQVACPFLFQQTRQFFSISFDLWIIFRPVTSESSTSKQVKQVGIYNSTSAWINCSMAKDEFFYIFGYKMVADSK